jgi:ATP-binding cassette, subfamily B, multidrug efflux pump
MTTSPAPTAPDRPNIPLSSGGPGRFGAQTRIERAQDPRGSLRRLAGYLLPYKLRLILLVLVLMVSTGLDLASPYVMGRAIDSVKDLGRMASLCLALLALYLLTGLGQYVQSAMMASISQKALRDLRQDLFNRLQSLPLSFFDGHTHGDLMSRLTNDIDAINRLIAQNITQLLASVLTVVIIVAATFTINFWMALGTLSVFPFLLVITSTIARLTRRSFRDLQLQLGQMNGMLEETITGERIVQAFCREQTAILSFDVFNIRVRDTGTRAQFLSLLVPPLITGLMNLDIAVVAGLGGWLATKGMISIGMIATFITYSRRISNPFRQIGDLYNSIQAALAGAERVFNVMNEPAETGLRNGGDAEMSVQGDVEFDHVGFAYTRGVPVLSDVSFHARPGQTIALVGPTGAGKTTIINLLSRFYDIQSGVIRVDGKDIREIPREALRRQLSVVLQDTFLFTGSVMDNIRYGRLDARDDECIAAARTANADQFIRRLPLQYQTELSERASNLSQGQRQLLAIARAVLANPRILILDEATSNVDTRTEVRIQQAMLRLTQGRTSFVIAHRLSTIRNADGILVINNGQIVESGTHAELLEQKGFYYHLYTSQFRGLPMSDKEANPALSSSVAREYTGEEPSIV